MCIQIRQFVLLLDLREMSLDPGFWQILGKQYLSGFTLKGKQLHFRGGNTVNRSARIIFLTLEVLNQQLGDLLSSCGNSHDGAPVAGCELEDTGTYVHCSSVVGGGDY